MPLQNFSLMRLDIGETTCHLTTSVHKQSIGNDTSYGAVEMSYVNNVGFVRLYYIMQHWFCLRKRFWDIIEGNLTIGGYDKFTSLGENATF